MKTSLKITSLRFKVQSHLYRALSKALPVIQAFALDLAIVTGALYGFYLLVLKVI